MNLTARQKRIVTSIVAVTMVVFFVPAMFMVGCNMPMTKGVCQDVMGRMATLSQACTGIWVQTHGIDGVAAAGITTLLFALAFALVASASLLGESRREPVMVPVRAGPPPPVTDPLGERLTL